MLECLLKGGDGKICDAISIIEDAKMIIIGYLPHPPAGQIGEEGFKIGHVGLGNFDQQAAGGFPKQDAVDFQRLEPGNIQFKPQLPADAHLCCGNCQTAFAEVMTGCRQPIEDGGSLS